MALRFCGAWVRGARISGICPSRRLIAACESDQTLLVIRPPTKRLSVLETMRNSAALGRPRYLCRDCVNLAEHAFKLARLV
jgi:hypothetical protein